MARLNTRVPGSGFTIFQWEKQLIGFAENVRVQGVRPVAEPVPIQPLNAQRPLEIVTAGAHGAGSITLTLTELYGRSVWQRLRFLARSQDIVDISRRIAELNQGIEVTKVVRPHNASNAPFYHETFYNVVVASVDDDEDLNITTMTLPKTMNLMFTHSRKSWINGGNYLFSRDVRQGSV